MLPGGHVKEGEMPYNSSLKIPGTPEDEYMIYGFGGNRSIIRLNFCTAGFDWERSE